MPNDAKLGLIVGVGLVIAVAVVFFRKDPVTAHPPVEEEAALARQRADPTPPARSPGTPRTPQGKKVSRTEGEGESKAQTVPLEAGEPDPEQPDIQRETP